MFDSIYSTTVTATQFFMMSGISLAAGVFFAWIMSFKVRSKKRFFIVASILPFIISSVITFVNGNIGAGIAIGGAFGLIRFRSAQGSADELASILIAMASGIAFGMGYAGYGVVILIGMSLLFFLLSYLPIFEHNSLAQDRILKITIPESLAYNDVFDKIFSKYLKSYESMGVKTTGMGSMFRLSYKIQMKNSSEEKAFIDELRTKNGNLEISVMPYEEQITQL